jgi:hypothetical protein
MYCEMHAILSYAKHMSHSFQSQVSSYSCSVTSNHKIARCTYRIRQTHWPLCLKSKFSNYTRARYQAIIQLRDELLLYAKHSGYFALNSKSVATRARFQTIMQLRDELLLYAKHIGHFAVNPNSLSYSCSVSSNHAIVR